MRIKIPKKTRYEQVHDLFDELTRMTYFGTEFRFHLRTDDKAFAAMKKLIKEMKRDAILVELCK